MKKLLLDFEAAELARHLPEIECVLTITKSVSY